SYYSFFYKATTPTQIYTLSLHDALPILSVRCAWLVGERREILLDRDRRRGRIADGGRDLACQLTAHVARREQARDRGHHPVIGEIGRAHVVFEVCLDEARVGLEPDENEHTADQEVRALSRPGAREFEVMDTALGPLDLDHLLIPDHFDLG